MKVKELLNKLDFSSMKDKSITLVRDDPYFKELNYKPTKFYNLEKQKINKRICYNHTDENNYWHGQLSDDFLNNNISSFSIITKHFDVILNITTNI